MSQTLLGVLALGLVGMLSFVQLSHQMRDSRSEIEVSASDHVRHTMIGYLGQLGMQPFDEAVRDADISSAAQLTPLIPFDPQHDNRFGQQSERRAARLATDTPNDDLDDLDGTTLTRTIALPEGNVRLDVTAVVGYVRDTDGETPSLQPTKLKKVSLRITSPDLQGLPPIFLSRVFACGTACDW